MLKKIAIISGCTLLILAAVIYYLMHYNDLEAPEITFSFKETHITSKTQLTVTAYDLSSYISSIEVYKITSGNKTKIAQKKFSQKSHVQTLDFTLPGGTGQDGEFLLEINAYDNSWANLGRGNVATFISQKMFLDNTAPTAKISPSMLTIIRGGSGCITFTPSEMLDDAYVKVGKHAFPAFRQNNGSFVCLFAFPYYEEVDTYTPFLFMRDLSGNTTELRLPIKAVDHKFKDDLINISAAFLNEKADEFEELVPNEDDLIKLFLRVNNDIRAENSLILKDLSKNTSQKRLWSSSFMRQPNSSTNSNFGDQRTYMHQDEAIDYKVHLGLDMISVARDKIPAANSGTVIYAEYLGIYGNMVMIDHGLGLHSTYSHLSRIHVRKGDKVKKGHIIGQTGATGMAGGDHLHFEILLSGMPVQPDEWLDETWVKKNIINRLSSF